MHTFNECVPLCELELLFSLFLGRHRPVLSHREKRISGGFPLVFNRLRTAPSVKIPTVRQRNFSVKGEHFPPVRSRKNAKGSQIMEKSA